MPPIAKVFTVTRNETDLVESFILYHGRMFGYQNIIIIDNMSTCPIVKEVYTRYNKLGVTIVHERSHGGLSQGNAYTKYMVQQKNMSEFLIGLDTDEFLYLRGMANTSEDICKYLKSIPKHISKLKINTYFSSVPDVTSPHYNDQKIPNPATQITTFKTHKMPPNKCKYIFRGSHFISTVNGCHGGATTTAGVVTCNRFVYFQFYNTGSRTLIEKALAFVHENGYVDTSSPLSNQLDSLVDLTPSLRVPRVVQYTSFLRKVLCLQTIIAKGKWPTQHQLLSEYETFPRKIDVSHMEALPSDWKLRYDAMILHDALETGDITHTGIKNAVVEQMQPLRPVLKCKPIKRVALLLSGHIRNFAPRKEFWMDFNKKYGDKVDIYVHTWNESGARSHDEWIDVGRTPPDFDEIRQVIKPSDMLVEDHSEKINSFSLKQPGLQLYYTDVKYLNRTTDFTRNIGSQLYSVMKSWELARDSNVEYDVMIRLRNDCIIENFGNIFTRDTSFLNDNVVVINGNSHRHAHGGGGCNKCTLEYPVRTHNDHVNDVCDIMYLGSPKVMGRVCNMFKDARKLVMSFKEYNEAAVKDNKVQQCLVKYPDAVGVKSPKVFETRLKCFYPERLIREYMKDYWLITDFLGLLVRVKY